MEQLLLDVRYALRRMKAAPAVTAIAILTIALGVGTNTAIFSIADAVLFRAAPFAEPDRIVNISETDSATPDSRIPVAYPTVLAWRGHHDVVDTLATWMSGSAIVVERQPERVSVSMPSTGYFAVYGVRPLHGRDFTEDDMKTGAEPVAIVSHALWQKYFGGDPAAVGRPLHLADATPVIVGVLPDFPLASAVYRPLQLGSFAASPQARQFPVIARLKAGVTIEQARAVLEPVARQLADPVERARRGMSIEPYTERTARYARPTLRVLAGAVAFVLLIACVNMAGLMFARGATRGREIALRLTLGAGRRRILQQLLIEACILGVAGGAAGALAAWVSLDAIVAAVPLSLPATAQPAMDLRVLAFALGLSVACGVLFGLLPAWRLSQTELVPALGGGGRTPTPLPRRLSRSLIAIEIALTLVLVSGASLMIRSLSALYGVDKGFNPAGVITLEAAPVRNDDATYRRYYESLLDRVRALPGVQAAGAADSFPLGPSRSMTRATPADDPGAKPRGIVVTSVLPGFFESMRIPLRAGRAIDDQDRSGTPKVAVMNESAARAIYPDAGALGRQLNIGKDTVEIVGVVSDVRSKDLASQPEPELYRAYRQSTATALDGRAVGRSLALVVRTSGDPRALGPILREQAQAAGEPALVQRVRPLDQWIDDSARVTRQRTTLLVLLGALGMLLALIGVFGMTSYAVSQRTREIGVRVALGATARDIMRAVAGGAAASIVLGVAAGLAATFWLTRTISSFLFEVKSADPISIGSAALLLAIAAGAAAYLPARRALRVDPVEALRVE